MQISIGFWSWSLVRYQVSVSDSVNEPENPLKCAECGQTVMVHLHYLTHIPILRPIPIKCVQNQWKFASVLVWVQCKHFRAF